MLENTITYKIRRSFNSIFIVYLYKMRENESSLIFKEDFVSNDKENKPVFTVMNAVIFYIALMIILVIMDHNFSEILEILETSAYYLSLMEK